MKRKHAFLLVGSIFLAAVLLLLSERRAQKPLAGGLLPDSSASAAVSQLHAESKASMAGPKAARETVPSPISKHAQALEDSIVEVLGRSDRLYQRYRAGLRSRLEQDILLGYVAYDVCITYVRPLSYPLEKAQPDGASFNRLTAIRATMSKRCSEFSSERIEDFTRSGAFLRKAFEEELVALSPGHIDIPTNATQEELEAASVRLANAIRTYGVGAMYSHTRNIPNWLRERFRQSGPNSAGSVFSDLKGIDVAAALSICDAGFDCSADSNLFGVVCGVHQDCGETVQHSLMRNLASEEDRKRVLAQASAIAAAFKNRDPQSLGLPPP